MLAVASSNSFGGFCYHSFFVCSKIRVQLRKPIKTFVLEYQKNSKRDPNIFLFESHMFLPHIDISRPAPHLRNRQTHDHETNQFFFLFEHR